MCWMDELSSDFHHYKSTIFKIRLEGSNTILVSSYKHAHLADDVIVGLLCRLKKTIILATI